MIEKKSWQTIEKVKSLKRKGLQSGFGYRGDWPASTTPEPIYSYVLYAYIDRLLSRN
jgi:hypothetical protein